MSLQNTQNLVTDLCRDNTQSVLLKQYEKNSRFIIVKCTENGVFKKLDKGTMVCNIKVLTPDDRAIYDPCEILDDGTVKVSVSESMVYTAGVAKAELNIIEQSSTALLSTMIFNIIIKPSAYGDDKIVASEEFSALTKLMTTVEQTVQTVISLETKINNKQTEWEANENTRKTNELARVNNETTREDNETARQQAESLRESNTSTAISNANKATSAANKATEDANTAISNANTAADRANKAAQDVESIISGKIPSISEEFIRSLFA